ncbi:[LysW]-aminoadipate kinase [Actinosynnema sp. NPDC047251]|uniref:[LysW]-aminoadipate kinase n=1 Tax=Saccharothrix espanaensis TaxID=103731 RepID=UPI0002D4A91E|nr:[LysW]-aminoadipate kinase [Saccharothrix espanaensis]
MLVVKCGGADGIRADAVCADVAGLVSAGTPVVLVHGGSAAVDRLAGRLGVPARRLVSPSGVTTRHTDAAALEVLTLALLGAVRPALLTELGRLGVAAVGLSGADAGLLRAERKKATRARVDGRTVVVRDDHSGRIVEVRAGLLRALLAEGYTPVVSPPGVATDDGGLVNVNADRVASAVAVALGARALVLLTAAPGVLADPADERSVLAEHRVAGSDPPAHVRGGMAVKLIAAAEALAGGIGEVVVADGRVDRPVSAALAGGGTRVSRG